MKTSFKSLLAAGALFAGLLFSQPAQAAWEAHLDHVNDNGDGTFTFNYRFVIGPDTEVRNGDTLVIYDFAGYVPLPGPVPSIFVASGFEPVFNATVQNSGPYPGGTPVTDDPGVENLVFQYTGGANLTETLQIGGPGGFFGADSIYGDSHAVALASASVSLDTPTNTNNNDRKGIDLPLAVIPEGSSLMMLLPGLLPVGLLLRKRAAKK